MPTILSPCLIKDCIREHRVICQAPIIAPIDTPHHTPLMIEVFARNMYDRLCLICFKIAETHRTCSLQHWGESVAVSDVPLMGFAL